MRAVPLLAGCLIAIGAGAAAAQPQQPAPQPPDAQPAQPQPDPGQPQPTPPAPPPMPAYAPRNDAAWQLYHEAFDALLQGQRKRAAELAARLEREHAGHPAAALVAALPLAVNGLSERVRRAAREEPSSSATAELALFQTLHGLIAGVEVCFAFDCPEEGVGVALTLIGAAAGAVLSLKVAGPVTSGQRALLNGGAIWGAFNAAMVLIAAEPDDESSIALGMLSGQAAGLIAGGVLYSSRPTAGQVALASSGGQWGATLMALMLRAASTGQTNAQVTLSMMAGADVGIAMGGYVAKLRPDISRAQTLALDAGGIVGLVGGGGLGVMLSGSIEDRTTAGMAGLGAAAGIALAAYFTRNWGDRGDGGDGGAHALLMPAEHGRGGLVGVAGTW